MASLTVPVARAERHEQQQQVTARRKASSGGLVPLPSLRSVSLVLCFFCTLNGVVGFAFAFFGLVRNFGGPLATDSLIALACIQIAIAIAGMLGLKGVTDTSSAFVKASLGFLLICVLAAIGVAVLTHLKLISTQHKLASAIESQMKNYTFEYRGEPISKNDRNVDEMQTTHKCCGSTSPSTWKYSKLRKLPHSCCYVSSDCVQVTDKAKDFQTALDFLTNVDIPDKKIFHKVGCTDVIFVKYTDAQGLICACTGSNACFLFVIFLALFSYRRAMPPADLL